MQSTYFDDHVPGQGVNVNEFLGPAGRRKEIRVKCFEGFKKDKELYRTRRQVDLDLATSINFVNFQAKCEPGQVLAKVWKIFKNAKSIKLGKLRPYRNFIGSRSCSNRTKLGMEYPQGIKSVKQKKIFGIACLGKKFVLQSEICYYFK